MKSVILHFDACCVTFSLQFFVTCCTFFVWDLLAFALELMLFSSPDDVYDLNEKMSVQFRSSNETFKNMLVVPL